MKFIVNEEEVISRSIYVRENGEETTSHVNFEKEIPEVLEVPVKEKPARKKK